MLDIPNMVMIGGNSRNTGKSTVACSIISRLSASHEVIGLKATSIRPGEDAFHGSHSDEVNTGFTIYEELNTGSDKDTSRMLRAGATHVYYIRSEDVFLKKAISYFMSAYSNKQPVVCESRSLRNIITPGLFIMMMRLPSVGVPKDVATYLDKADLVFNWASQQEEIQQFSVSLQFVEGKFRYISADCK